MEIADSGGGDALLEAVDPPVLRDVDETVVSTPVVNFISYFSRISISFNLLIFLAFLLCFSDLFKHFNGLKGTFPTSHHSTISLSV